MQHYQFEVDEASSKKRLDVFLSENLPEISRSRLKKLIDEKRVTVNARSRPAGYKVRVKEKIEFHIPPLEKLDTAPENIPLDIIFEDEHMLAVNKPAGMVVHPAPGHSRGTLVNALLHHCKDLSGIGGVERPGIVHRLDKDTTGLMVVAKTLTAHAHIVEQLQSREMGREYETVVAGVMTSGGTINEPIARSTKNRKKMAVTPFGKKAVTHYRVLERFPAHTHIRVKLETGRTHQIRVHMSHIKRPIIGDSTYGGRFKLPPGVSSELKEELQNFGRQALHAKKITLIHPKTQEEMSWESELPDDMQSLLSNLAETKS